MSVIEVGKLYIKGRTQWPEAIEYNYDFEGHILRLFLRSPTAKEIAAIRNGAIDLALIVEDSIVFFLVQFPGGGLPWSDCPYCYWSVPEGRRQTPPMLAENQRAVLNILLVDADTGIVQVMRVVSLEHDFSVLLHTAIAAQIDAGPITPADYALIAQRIQSRTSEELANSSAMKIQISTRTKKKGFC